MNVMGALVMIKKNPLKLMQPIRLCHSCKYARPYTQVIIIDENKVIEKKHPDRVRCLKRMQVVPIELAEWCPYASEGNSYNKAIRENQRKG